MRRVFGWLLVVLCCAAGGAAGEARPEARLVEAQAAFDEATKLRDAGGYSEALARAEHALALREAVLGGSHPDVASCLSLVGDLHRRKGNLAQAEPLIQRALAIQEAALGPNHPSVAQSLNNLAVLYMYQGLFGRASPLLQRTLAIQEAALGPHHVTLGETLTYLARSDVEQGLYDRAEPLFQRALAIREAVLGKNHPNLALTLNILANLYRDQGVYDRAEPLLQRALAIYEAALGKSHPNVAAALNSLAGIYRAQGLFDRAEPLHLRALAIREAALGKNHPDVAQTLNNLANLYTDHGLYGRAEPLYQRALTLREAAFGKSHPMIAESIHNLANLYMEQGLYDRAEPRYQRALALYEATLGKNHPTLAAALANLARMRLAQHRFADALPLYTRAFATSEQRLRHEALGFSESRLASFLQHLREGEQTLYTLLREYPKDVRVQRLALGAALLLKGRSVEETANISHTLYRGLGPEDRDTLERLRGLRIQLASLSLAGPGSLSPGDYQQRLKSLADEGDLLEADLAKRSAPLRALTALPPLAEIVDRVAAALPKDGALVEFIAYADKPFLPKPGKPHTRPSSQLRYLALVLFPDASTRAVALGPAEPIDRAASHLRNALANRDASFQLTAQELYQRAFQPLLPLLGKTRRLFLSPDSQLGAVPFAALHDGHGFLLDSFDFSYLTSGRELLTRPQDIPPSSSVFVLADPDFSASPRPASSASGNIPLLAESADSLDRFFSTLRADPVSSTWVPLPGSRQEAESIQRLLPQAQLFLGPEATKQRLLQLSTPGILHLATHGFFLEDAPTPEGSRGVGHFGALGDNRQASHPRNPLLRSGLALAGASEPSKSRPAAALVTALELAGLDLWGTQLVVLSACDTGRGEVQLGQGVQGLRRALVVAGAETVVMSLWKVKDDSTRLLMESYYRNLLAGQGRASALREAMRSLRASRPHPHDWAPFIALGSNAPLRSITPPSREPAGQ
ncbi:MAG TPA: tetratricopeptide repeat protein [Myxococcaceae bacterium]|nr:tetratricopeptide repeat protein [Myxococcaceae bacterium]